MAQIQDKNRANAIIVLPVVGETKFDENGIAEVDDDKVNELISKVEGLGLGPGHRDNEEAKEEVLVDENEGVNEGSGDGDAISGGSGVIEPVEEPVIEEGFSEKVVKEGAEGVLSPVVNTPVEGVVEEIVAEVSGNSDTISNEEVVNKIKTSNLKELKELAGALDVPKSEWVSLNKPELKDYLLNKIK